MATHSKEVIQNHKDDRTAKHRAKKAYLIELLEYRTKNWRSHARNSRHSSANHLRNQQFQLHKQTNKTNYCIHMCTSRSPSANICSTLKKTQRSPKFQRFDKGYSSVESENSCPHSFKYNRRQKRARDSESHRPRVIQSVLATVSQWEPIPNAFLSPVIGIVSPTDPRICPGEHCPDEKNMNFDDKELREYILTHKL